MVNHGQGLEPPILRDLRVRAMQLGAETILMLVEALEDAERRAALTRAEYEKEDESDEGDDEDELEALQERVRVLEDENRRLRAIGALAGAA